LPRALPITAMGPKYWIPFIEWDVEARDKFDSHFMTDFISGKEALVVAEPNLFYHAGSGDMSMGF